METVRVSYVKKLWRQLILWRHLGEKFKFVGLTMLISLLVEIWFFVSNVHRLTDFSFTPMGVVSCYNSKILAPRFRMFCWFAMLKDGWLFIRVPMLMLSNFLSSPSFTSISAFTCFPVTLKAIYETGNTFLVNHLLDRDLCASVSNFTFSDRRVLIRFVWNLPITVLPFSPSYG